MFHFFSCKFISWNKPKPGEKWEPEESKENTAENKKTKKNSKKKNTKNKLIKYK